MVQLAAFATGVLANIYEFHLYTRSSTHLSRTQAVEQENQARRWTWTLRAQLIRPPTRALRPVNPNNASPLRITAAAGTKLAGASSVGTVIIFPTERALQP